jgi:8-oxo-dGTP pyrophosphatase MutT (NUDIX family)
MRHISLKVIAYITHGGRLLVFRHTDHPEAGIQVPGGTMEPGESPDDAVLREAQEETGLDALEIRVFLGVQEVDLARFGLEGLQRRYVYHLGLRGGAPESWLHYESTPSDGTPGPIEFEFFWVRLPDEVPELAGAQGEFLDRLAAWL